MFVPLSGDLLTVFVPLSGDLLTVSVPLSCDLPTGIASDGIAQPLLVTSLTMVQAFLRS